MANIPNATHDSLVRKGGLEPPHLSAPEPKSGASTNSATFARYFLIDTQSIIRISSNYGSLLGSALAKYRPAAE